MTPAEAETETHTLPLLCGITSETPAWITPVHNSWVALTIMVIVSKVRWQKIMGEIMNISFILQFTASLEYLFICYYYYYWEIMITSLS